MSDVCGEVQAKVTDEERRRCRDQLSDEERWKLFEESNDRAMRQLFLGNRGSVETRLDQIEKRLEILELKK